MKDAYTLPEVEKKLNVTRRTLYNYIDKGYLKAEKLDGYRVYITAADLKEFTTGQTSKGRAIRKSQGVNLPTVKERQRQERQQKKGAQ